MTPADAPRHGAERAGFNDVQARLLVDAGRFKANSAL
jgi:hypothetical protein